MQKTEIMNNKLPSLGFPWAVRIKNVAEWIFISGVPPMDKLGAVVEKDNAIAQFTYEMDRILEILKAEGLDLKNLVSLTITVTQKADLYANWDTFVRVYQKYFPDIHGPAGGTLRIVSALSHPKMLVETEAIAAK